MDGMPRRVLAPGTLSTMGGMCRAVTCKQCGRLTWKGCGLHVEQVLGDVAPEDRCSCALGAPKAKKHWFGR